MGIDYGAGAAAITGFTRGMQIRGQLQAQATNEKLALQKAEMAQSTHEMQMKQQEQLLKQMTMKIEQAESQKLKTDIYSAWDEGSVIKLNQTIDSSDRARKLFGVQNVRFYPLVPTRKQDAQRQGMKEPMLGTQVNPDGTTEEIVFDMNKKKIGSGYANYKKELDYKKEEQEQRRLAIQAKIEASKAKIEASKASIAKSKAGGTTMVPFDIQTAEYFGDIKAKIASGEATDEERATYNAWLQSKGGTDVAKVELGATRIQQAEKIAGMPLENIDMDKVTPKQKGQLYTLAKHLENTKSGKELLNNMSKGYEDGIGTIESSSSKLLELSQKKNVDTNIMNNLVDSVAEYVPESLRPNNIEKKDLENVEFRKAYTSVLSSFLKIQSGLTVSDKERETFEKSFGTLNRIMPVNMMGLITKLEETKARYAKNKELDPKLYNIKYSSTEKTLDNTISELRKGLETGVSTAPKKGRPSLSDIWSK